MIAAGNNCKIPYSTTYGMVGLYLFDGIHVISSGIYQTALSFT